MILIICYPQNELYINQTKTHPMCSKTYTRNKYTFFFFFSNIFNHLFEVGTRTR